MIDEFACEKVTGEEMDIFLSKGFRHFGTYFFRYQMTIHNEELAIVLPLRINLSHFELSKSQRKLLKKNQNLTYEFKPTVIDSEIEEMFDEHSSRFKENKPLTIYSFLSETPATVPGETKSCLVYLNGKLIAVSFLDIGARSTSSIYGLFRLEYSKLRLGIFTMLLEIEYSRQLKKDFYYPGYAYNIPSFYDYKKEFNALQYLEWETEEWKTLERKTN